jgi:hypothetical protein
VENVGNTTRKGLGATGRVISSAADHAGNAAAWLADKSANFQNAVVSTAARANRWVEKQELHAATATGHAVVNTSRWMATQEARAAHWAVQQVEQGARTAGNWAQDRVNDAKRFFGGLF